MRKASDPGEPRSPLRRITAIQQHMLPCRLCGGSAELWQRWEKEDVWHTLVCCSNLEDVDGEPCHFHMPDPVAFYRPRKRDAISYWNLIMGPRKHDARG